MERGAEKLRRLVPEVPLEAIATAPAEPRDSARLLVARKDSDELLDLQVRDLPGILAPGDVLILNDTRVVRARLVGLRASTGGKVELLCLPPRGAAAPSFEAIVGTRGKLTDGEVLLIGDGAVRISVLATLGGGRFKLQLERGALPEVMDQYGTTPLPPYIERARRHAETAAQLPTPDEDSARYQTVYAETGGAVAAPTAGLHFTEELLESLVSKGVELGRVTLHVGPGTFLPIRAADPREHPMASEAASIPRETVELIRGARERGARVLAVGTTSVRTLESAATVEGDLAAGELDASAFIFPPYAFRVVDGMLTNFHLPDSTPCLLVAALLGEQKIRLAYEHALSEGYRFYSFGDAMLVL